MHEQSRYTWVPFLLLLLLIGLLIWATAPAFHWLWFGVFYRHPVGVLLFVIIDLLGLRAVLRARRSPARAQRTTARTRTPIVGCGIWLVVVALGLLFFGYARWSGALAQYLLVRDLQPELLAELPETTEIRYLPMSVAERYGENRVQDPLYHLGDFDPLDAGTDLAWVAPRVPSGDWNRLTGQNDGFVVVRSDGSVETIAQPMRYGEEMLLTRSIAWQLLRRNYWVDYTEVYYIQNGDEVLGIAPYIGYRMRFPVLVPYWQGVAVFHGDGRIEYLSPAQAQADERFAGQRLFPEDLARQIAEAWAYRGGIANAWFRHIDQVEIPEIEGSANQMPYLLPSPNGPLWFIAAEPYGPAYGIYKMFWFDAHAGRLSLYELPVSSSLIGPNRALGYVRSAFPNYDWNLVVAIEPRPFVVRGELYWMVTITTGEAAGITHTALVDARTAGVVYFNSLQELHDFQAGAFAGRTPPAAQGSSGATPTPQPFAGPTLTPTDLGRLTDKELIDLLRAITEELAKRQK